MGLDACVYCDCLEKRLLRNPLPASVTIEVDDDGYPVVVKGGQRIDNDHPDYVDFACVHELRKLVTHRLGNISLVGLLRSELSRTPDLFPVILKKVIYSGSHGGDRLNLSQIPALRAELQKLTAFKCVGSRKGLSLMTNLKRVLGIGWYPTAESADKFLQEFRIQMIELADAAEKVGKPICF
jgi:hypothetical protein